MVEVPTLRNLAIIAHVDHGKTTLIDRILGQCHGDVGTERVMDSMSLEQERCARDCISSAAAPACS